MEPVHITQYLLAFNRSVHIYKELLALVTEVISRLGDNEGEKFLNKFYPELYEFYNEYVFPNIKQYLVDNNITEFFSDAYEYEGNNVSKIEDPSQNSVEILRQIDSFIGE